MYKLVKNKQGVTKKIDNEALLADYVAAGWEIVKEDKIKTNFVKGLQK